MDVKDYHKELELLTADVLILAIDGHIPARTVMDDLRVEVNKRILILENGWGERK